MINTFKRLNDECIFSINEYDATGRIPSNTKNTKLKCFITITVRNEVKDISSQNLYNSFYSKLCRFLIY